MAYQVALLNFEGPLDLLLQLVEQARLSPATVSLGELTEQYLEHLTAAKLDPGEASGFSAVAAKLLYIKSVGLIPNTDTSEAEEAAEELQQQIEAYGHYREAAAFLAQLWQAPERSWGRPRTQCSAGSPNLPPNVTLSALQKAFATATASHQATHTVAPEVISIKEMMLQLATEAPSSLNDFFGRLGSRLEIVVAFLAALELWRAGRLQLTQTQQFSIIGIDHANPHPPA